MLDELFKIDWMYMWELVGGPNAGLAGIINAIALLMIGFGLKTYNNVTADMAASVKEANTRFIRMEKTVDELTDAVMRNNDLRREELVRKL